MIDFEQKYDVRVGNFYMNRTRMYLTKAITSRNNFNLLEVLRDFKLYMLVKILL